MSALRRLPFPRRYIFVAAHQSGLTVPTVRQWARSLRFAVRDFVGDGALVWKPLAQRLPYVLASARMTGSFEEQTMRVDGAPKQERPSIPAVTRALRGFALLTLEERQRIASMGGCAAHERGTAYKFTSETAQLAGRRGGLAVSENREHMARIGQRGGEQRGANLRSRRAAKELPLVLPGPSLPLLLALILSLCATRDVSAQRAMPDSASQTNFNPLCDGSLVHCLEIDDFAGHLYGNLQVLPKTEHRDTAAVFPFGVTLGLFGRFAGGISTYYSFWNEGDVLYQQLGPLRLNLTGRLLPIFPLWSSGGSSEGGDRGDFHYTPPRAFRLGLSYEHEVRVGPFSGANSLGLLTDMASLYLIGSKVFGPFQLSMNVGALYDWRGSFATGTVAAQLGLFLPGFKALKIFVEGMARGFPAYVKKDALLPSFDGQDPIRRQGMVGGGIAFHPHARVDLGVTVQHGFGGIAPWVVSVNFLVLSVGKTYQGRAATPIAELAADLTSEAAIRIKEFIANLPVDPKLDENCILLDKDNVTVLGRFGKRTKDGYYCEEDGFRVPINHEFERDPHITKICRDTELKDCILERRGKEWVPIHRPKLDSNCDMYDTDGTYLGRVGKPTEDGERCRYPVEKPNGFYGTHTTYEEQPIDKPFHTDSDRSRVCVDEAMQHCFLKPPAGRGTLAVEGSERFAKRYDQDISGDVEKAKARAQKTAKDIAEGKISVSTIAEEARRAAQNAIQAAEKAANLAKNPGKAIDAAKDKAAALVQAVEDWTQKPPEEQLDDVAHVAANETEDAVLGAAGHAVSGVMGGVRTVGKLEHAGEAAQSSKKARKAAARAVKKEEAVADHAASAVDLAETLSSSRAARREAMKLEGIPRSQQPSAQIRTPAGMQYEYQVPAKGGKVVTKIVTQQTTDRVAGHGPHWEAGLIKNKTDRDPYGRLRVRNGKTKTNYSE